MRIKIAAIEVDAPVVPVGQTSTGDVASPPSWTTVGWFERGYHPGDPGHAVLLGHLDTDIPQAPEAVFWRLHALKLGDAITLWGGDGRVVRYVVATSQTYPLAGFPLQEVFGGGSASVLELITCTGTWRGPQLGYDHRLVVTAEMAA